MMDASLRHRIDDPLAYDDVSKWWMRPSDVDGSTPRFVPRGEEKKQTTKITKKKRTKDPKSPYKQNYFEK